MAQRMRPVAFAKQEDLVDLESRVGAALDEVASDLTIFKAALLNALGDVEDMSNVLVDAGLLTVEDDESGDDEDYSDDGRIDPRGGPEPSEDQALRERDEDHEELEQRLHGEEDYSEFEEDSNDDLDVTRPPDEEPKPVVGRKARLEAVRARRAAAVAEQGLRDFEAANETSEAEASSDGNDIVGVPEDGITVGEGRDPFTGEPIE